MSEQLKYIIQELNKPPFNKSYNLISFDTLETLQLLQILTDVFAEIDLKHKVDVREEAADQTAIRLLTMLRVLKYRPPPETDQNAFRQGLVQGDKLIIYPILEWLLQRIPDLKKRAYLAKYLVKLEIATELRADDQVEDLYQQYETLITEFKEIHKQSEQLRQSGYNTGDIKKDISSMEDEKEQLIKRVERLKRRVDSQSNSSQMLAAARDLRLEKDREEKVKKQKHEQKNAIIQLSQRLERLQQQIKDVKQASIGATPEGLLAKLEEETKVNSYMLKDRLPKEISACKKTVGDLQKVVAEPAMGPSDLDVIKKKIHETNSEVNQLVEKRMMSSDPIDDKLSLFRQQAAIIARKKEVAAEKLREAREELERYEREASEKREYMKQCDGSDALKGEDFKRYVNKLRTKSTVFKKKRQEMAELRAEAGVLSRTEEILKYRQESINKQLTRMEKKQGVLGYRDTQERLEKASEVKSEMDHLKGQTLEDISGLVTQLMKKIQDKRNALAPIVSELRVTRKNAQELGTEYEEKKTAYESIAAGLESNSSKLEQEVRTYREELNAEETRFHYLNAMIRIVEIQQERINDEMKAYTSSNTQDKKKALREQYTRKIQEQENLGKSLRDQQKVVRENQGINLRQMKMWRDLERLIDSKLGGRTGHRAGGDEGGHMRRSIDSVPFGYVSSAADEDRLVL